MNKMDHYHVGSGPLFRVVKISAKIALHVYEE